MRLFLSFCCTTRCIFEPMCVFEPGFNTDKYGTGEVNWSKDLTQIGFLNLQYKALSPSYDSKVSIYTLNYWCTWLTTLAMASWACLRQCFATLLRKALRTYARNVRKVFLCSVPYKDPHPRCIILHIAMYVAMSMLFEWNICAYRITSNFFRSRSYKHLVLFSGWGKAHYNKIKCMV